MLVVVLEVVVFYAEVWAFEFVVHADVLAAISFGSENLIIIKQRRELLLLLDQLKIHTNLLPSLLIYMIIAPFLLSRLPFIFDTGQRREIFLKHLALLGTDYPA